MLTIDFSKIALILSVIGSLTGAIIFVFNLMRRFENLEKANSHLQSTSKVLCKGLFAVLDGLHQQGCNGEVSKALNMLKDHVIDE